LPKEGMAFGGGEVALRKEKKKRGQGGGEVEELGPRVYPLSAREKEGALGGESQGIFETFLSTKKNVLLFPNL